MQIYNAYRSLRLWVIMSLTASEVASLSATLLYWEIAEYSFGGLVALACFGEYAADFTNWFTSGDESKKRRLAKKSTLLLIASLALELICLVRTNQLSSRLFGSLADKASEAYSKSEAAERKAKDASDALGETTRLAGEAKTVATGAKTVADNAARISSRAVKDAEDAKRYAGSIKGIADQAKTVAEQGLATARVARQEATEVQALVEATRQQVGILEASVARIKATRVLVDPDGLVTALRQYEGTEYGFSAVNGDSDSTDLLAAIERVLRRAGWKRVDQPGSLQEIGIPVDGVTVYVAQLPRTGIGIAVQSTEPIGLLSTLASINLEMLPPHVAAAIALRSGLHSAIIPTEEMPPHLVDAGPGFSWVVLISVGKYKP